ncbi:stalk domain-containing protein [Wukongibacter baidiensis]|uniref:DUF7910 domain-containing protein n=1 Tax=Wukongibacter baidiensis TaxID=1723361 RepID=UPI003D7FE374
MKRERRLRNLATIFLLGFAMLIVLAVLPMHAHGTSDDTVIVAIKTYDGKYLCAEGGGGGEVVANRDKIGKWESFKVIDLGDGKFALKTYNGKYLCAENGGGKEVVADRNEVREWETFELEYIEDDIFAIKAYNGKYLCAENGGGGEVVANRDKIGNWEEFRFVKSNISFPKLKLPSEVTLQAYNGKYLSAEDGGGEEIYATSSRTSNWEEFRVVQSTNDKIALRVHNGKYIDVQDRKSGEIEADSSRIDDSSKFQVVDLGNNRIALRAYNGEFLGIEDEDKELVASFEEVSKRTIFKFMDVDGDTQDNQKYNLRATAGNGYVKFSWNRSNKSNVIGYNLYRGTSSGKQSKTPITDFPIVGNSYTDRNVENNRTYYYILKAVYKNNSVGQASNQVVVRPSSNSCNKKRKIILKVGSKYMTVDGKRREIDPGKGTKLIIKNGRTFLPIRAFIESIGGKVSWNGSNREVRVLLDNKEIRLWIGKKAAKVNGKTRNNDVAPFISDTSRTMIPLRFIVENLGCDVEWDGQTKTVEIEID